MGWKTLGLGQLMESSLQPGDPQALCMWECPLWAGGSPCEQGSPSRAGPWHLPEGQLPEHLSSSWYRVPLCLLKGKCCWTHAQLSIGMLSNWGHWGNRLRLRGAES